MQMNSRVHKSFSVLASTGVIPRRSAGGGAGLKPGCCWAQCNSMGGRRPGDRMRMNAQGLRAPPDLPGKDWPMDEDKVVEEDDQGRL